MTLSIFSPRRVSWSTTNLSTNCSQRFLRRRPWRRVSGASGPQSVTHSLILIMEMTSNIVAPFFFYSLFDYCCAQLGKKPAQTSTRTQQQDGLVGAETSFFCCCCCFLRETPHDFKWSLLCLCVGLCRSVHLCLAEGGSLSRKTLCVRASCVLSLVRAAQRNKGLDTSEGNYLQENNRILFMFMSFWRSQNINVVITLQVVIPASSVREVKKHNSALSMMSIETADREKVRTILLIHWLFIYLLFSFFSLLLMWSAFDWMLSRKGTFVHIISSLNWKIQLFIMQWYTVLIQSNLSNMKNSHLDLNWINQMSILNIIHSSCCRHWVKLFRRRCWLSPEWMSEYPTQR